MIDLSRFEDPDAQLYTTSWRYDYDFGQKIITIMFHMAETACDIDADAAGALDGKSFQVKASIGGIELVCSLLRTKIFLPVGKPEHPDDEYIVTHVISPTHGKWMLVRSNAPGARYVEGHGAWRGWIGTGDEQQWRKDASILRLWVD